MFRVKNNFPLKFWTFTTSLPGGTFFCPAGSMTPYFFEYGGTIIPVPEARAVQRFLQIRATGCQWFFTSRFPLVQAGHSTVSASCCVCPVRRAGCTRFRRYFVQTWHSIRIFPQVFGNPAGARHPPVNRRKRNPGKPQNSVFGQREIFSFVTGKYNLVKKTGAARRTAP